MGGRRKWEYALNYANDGLLTNGAVKLGYCSTVNWTLSHCSAFQLYRAYDCDDGRCLNYADGRHLARIATGRPGVSCSTNFMLCPPPKKKTTNKHHFRSYHFTICIVKQLSQKCSFVPCPPKIPLPPPPKNVSGYVLGRRVYTIYAAIYSCSFIQLLWQNSGMLTCMRTATRCQEFQASWTLEN